MYNNVNTVEFDADILGKDGEGFSWEDEFSDEETEEENRKLLLLCSLGKSLSLFHVFFYIYCIYKLAIVSQTTMIYWMMRAMTRILKQMTRMRVSSILSS